MANSIKLSSINSQNCISYLQQDHISNYTDVKLTSILDGYSVFVNRIMLASLSNYFRHEEILKEDQDEITIFCEHSKEILSIVESLVSGKFFLTVNKQLPQDIQEEIKQSFGINVALSETKSFVPNLIEPKTFPEVEVHIKKEPVLDLEPLVYDAPIYEDPKQDYYDNSGYEV